MDTITSPVKHIPSVRINVMATFAEPDSVSYLELAWKQLHENLRSFAYVYNQFRNTCNDEFIAITDSIIDESKKNFPNHNRKEYIDCFTTFLNERGFSKKLFNEHCASNLSSDIVALFNDELSELYRKLIIDIATQRSLKRWLHCLNQEFYRIRMNKRAIKLDLTNNCIHYQIDGQEYTDKLIFDDIDYLKQFINHAYVTKILIYNFEKIQFRIAIDADYFVPKQNDTQQTNDLIIDTSVVDNIKIIN